MKLVDQYWKQYQDGQMTYTHITSPKGQEQSLPRGATKITADAYYDAVGEEERRYDELMMSSDQDREDVSEVVVELRGIGLSSSSVARILRVSMEQVENA